MQVKVVAKELPERKTAKSAGYDLRIVDPVSIPPGETRLVGTGIRISLPENVAALVIPRSGLGNRGVSLGNCVGLIDPDYRGEIKASLYNRTKKYVNLSRGDRVAQLLFTPFVIPELIKVDELDETQRGDGGFGHTGNN